jgi:hypothetical protein
MSSSPMRASAHIIAERKILPLRSKRRGNGSSGVTQDILGPKVAPSRSDQSPSPAAGSSTRLLSPEGAGHTTNEYGLSVRSSDLLGTESELDRTPMISVGHHNEENMTFRGLHNITPTPSNDPEVVPKPLSSLSSEKIVRHSSLPLLATQDHEIPEPLHTTYSDEKIAVPTTSDPPRPRTPKIVEDYLNATPRTPPAASLSPAQEMLASPSPHFYRERSVSDVSAVSDINDPPSPYDIRDEEAPLEPFFTPKFQTALRDGLDIARSTLNTIKNLTGSSEPEPNLQRLLGDAERLSTWQSSETRTIAVLGDSGEGIVSTVRIMSKSG